MIQASHEEHLAACAVLICQISAGPIIKLAWSEMIMYVIDRNAKGMCTVLASAKEKSEDLPRRNPQLARCDAHMVITMC